MIPSCKRNEEVVFRAGILFIYLKNVKVSGELLLFMAFGGNGSMKLIILIFKAEMLIFPFFPSP